MFAKVLPKSMRSLCFLLLRADEGGGESGNVGKGEGETGDGHN